MLKNFFLTGYLKSLFRVSLFCLTLLPLLYPQALSASEKTRLVQGAQQGDPEMQYELGVMYHNRHDYISAFSWFQKAAEQNHIMAQYSYGMMYKEGQGVTRDDHKAFTWLQKSAQQGFAPAHYQLALMYRDGQGVEQDNQKSFALIQKAARLGFIPAQGHLGVLYRDGEGGAGKQDIKKAFHWIKKSCSGRLC